MNSTRHRQYNPISLSNWHGLPSVQVFPKTNTQGVCEILHSISRLSTRMLAEFSQLTQNKNTASKQEYRNRSTGVTAKGKTRPRPTEIVYQIKTTMVGTYHTGDLVSCIHSHINRYEIQLYNL